MGSSPKPPPAPDYSAMSANSAKSSAEVAKIQAQYNLQALQQSQAASMIGQNSAIGSMSYKQTGKDAYGNPMYTLDTKLSPEQQKLFNQTVGTQTAAGQQGLSLAQSSAPMYSDASTMINNIFSGADSLTGQRVNAALGFQQPFMQQDRGYLDSQLRNQGIMPGDPAYQRQMAELDKQQYGNQQNFISSVMPQSQSTAQSAYMLPLQVQQSLSQQGAPASVNQMNTPQFTAKPSDYTGAFNAGVGAQNQAYGNQIQGYQAQLGAQSNMMNGLFGIGGAAIKAAPMFI